MAAAPGTPHAPEPPAPEAPEAVRSALDIARSPQGHPDFDRFVATIAALRAPDGCPWDREQTHGSIAHNMVEEAYEALDAIEAGDATHMREELGDVLLQVVLQSQIAADAGEFTIDEVCRDINAKMVRRHPHVFGDAAAGSANDVLDLWDQVKLAEKGARDEAAGTEGSRREGLLDGVPASFPALMQAQKVSRKAAAAGFEWDTVADVWDKVREEIGEFEAVYAAAPKNAKGAMDVGADPAAAKAAELEFGDVLFALVNVARKAGIDAESALRASCAKFRARWAQVERGAWGAGREVEELSAGELEALWQRAKRGEGAPEPRGHSVSARTPERGRLA